MANNDGVEAGSDLVDPTLENTISFFCRHLVSLAGSYQPLDSSGEAIGEAGFFSFSGFVLSVRDTWHLVTAGHILKDLDKKTQNKEVKLTGCLLIDNFGLNVVSHTPIPFDYDNSSRYYIDDKADGLDFGLIALRPYYRRLLEVNGIVPVSEENWIYQPSIKFEHYIMLGLPTQFISRDIRENEITTSISPTMIGVTKLEDPPQDLPQTTFRRLVAKINAPLLVNDIDGMSGGPILGFSKEKGGLMYWIVAIQSSWIPQKKIIFGCPVPVFAGLVEIALQNYEASLEGQEQETLEEE